MPRPAFRVRHSPHGTLAGAAFVATLSFVALMGAFAVSEAPRSLPGETRASGAQPAPESTWSASSGRSDDAAVARGDEFSG